jgi:glycosyltransferase involved in cell wall biosynthesis
MRIALFADTYRPTVNGVARALGLLVDHAGRAGHEVALITPRLAEAAAGTCFHHQLPGPRFPLYPELRACTPRLSAAARDEVDRFRPDVVHAATEAGAGLAGRAWARSRGVPLVTSFNTLFPEYLHDYRLGFLEGSLWRYLRWFHGVAALTVTPSEWMRGELARRGFHPRTALWSRGVDSALFHPSKRSWLLRRALAPEADVILMYVGRIAREKKVNLLMEAFPQIRERTPRRVALVMVGDGPARAELEARRIPGVHFAGYKHGEELAIHYASADLFVFPSDTETFGQVVTEAQASGLPAVVPDRGGVTDTVTPCLTGYRFEPGDATSLARAAARLVDDPTKRVQMGARARAAAEQLSWRRVFDGLFARYRTLVHGSSARAAAPRAPARRRAKVTV